jgi:hypothetical protein
MKPEIPILYVSVCFSPHVHSIENKGWEVFCNRDIYNSFSSKNIIRSDGDLNSKEGEKGYKK